jgi:hypothetical protein
VGQMRARVIVVVLVAAFAAAGCSGGGAQDAPPAPEGFVRYTGAGYSFDHPAGWTAMPRRDETGEPEVRLAGAVVEPGMPQAEVLVGRQSPVRRHRFELQLGQYRAASRLTGRQVRVDHPVRVPGAEAAHRFEALALVPTRSGRVLRMEVTDLYVLTGDEMMVNIAVRALEGESRTARLPEVLDSFRVKEG